jgi:hypothetical protein
MPDLSGIRDAAHLAHDIVRRPAFLFIYDDHSVHAFDSRMGLGIAGRGGTRSYRNALPSSFTD